MEFSTSLHAIKKRKAVAEDSIAGAKGQGSNYVGSAHDFTLTCQYRIIVNQGEVDAIIGAGFQGTENLRLIPGIGMTNNSVN